MRDYSGNTSHLDQIDEICKFLVFKNDKSLRRAVRDSSNFHSEDETFFKLNRKSLTELIQLAILCWYLPEEIRFLLLLDLQQVEKRLQFEDQIVLKQLLTSKERMLLYLAETTRWHSRDFFGNILNKKCQVLSNLKVQPRVWMRKRAHRPQRKRGYSDKGSRALDHAGNPNKYINLTLELREEEFRRKSQEDTLLLLEGMLL